MTILSLGTADEEAARLIQWSIQGEFTVKKFDHAGCAFGQNFTVCGPFNLTSFDESTWISLAGADGMPVRLLHEISDFAKAEDFVAILPAYKIVLDVILGEIEKAQDTLNRVRVLRGTQSVLRGTPGIGKTYFGTFFAAHLLQQGRHVFYERDDYAVHLDPQSKTATRYEASSYAWRDLLAAFGSTPEGKAAFYLCDFGNSDSPWAPWAMAMNVFLITSPDEERYRKWAKQLMATLLFFPRPSRSDVLEVFVAKNGPAANISEIDERISVVGLKLREVVAVESFPLLELKSKAKRCYLSLPDSKERPLDCR